MRVLFLIISFLIVLNTNGQIEAPSSFFDGLKIKIDKIQEKNFDTVFAFIYIRGYPDFQDHELKGIGKTSVQNRATIIGLKGNQVKSIVLVDTYENILASQPLDLKNDTILQFLRKNASSFRFEEFLPYVWEIHPDSDSTVKGFYTKQHNLHEPFQGLYFKDSSGSRFKEFLFESLSENYLESDVYPPNLNFKYNTSLNLFRLYALLIQVSRKYERQFDFSK